MPLAAFNNYFHLLTQMGDTPAQVQAKIAALAQPSGLSLGRSFHPSLRPPVFPIRAIPEIRGLPLAALAVPPSCIASYLI